MSKIIIQLNQKTVSSDVLVGLQKITSKSISSIQQSVKLALPIVEENVFYNNHNDISLKLKNTVEFLKKNSVYFSIYELDEKVSFKDNINNDIDKIDIETMINILDSHGHN